MGCEGVNWMCLAQDRDQWLALVYTIIINLWVQWKARNFCCIELVHCSVVNTNENTHIFPCKWNCSEHRRLLELCDDDSDGDGLDDIMGQIWLCLLKL